MKKIISEIIWIIHFIIGLPFFIVDFFYKNGKCEWVISKVNRVMFDLNWWGNK